MIRVARACEIQHVACRRAIRETCSTYRASRPRPTRPRARSVRRSLGAFGHGGVEERRDDSKQQIRAIDDGDMRGPGEHRQL